MQSLSGPFRLGVWFLDDVEIEGISSGHMLQPVKATGSPIRSSVRDNDLLDDGIDLPSPMIEEPMYPWISWTLIERLPDELIDQAVIARNVIEDLNCHEAPLAQQLHLSTHSR